MTNKDVRAVLFDVDGTLIDGEGARMRSIWAELHRIAGTPDAVRSSRKQRHLDGEISYEEWFQEDLSGWVNAGLKKPDVARAAESLSVASGAHLVIRELSRCGIQIGVVSSSIRDVIEHHLPGLRGRFMAVNELEYSSIGAIIGYTTSPARLMGKDDVLRAFAAEQDLKPENVLFVGNDHNDLPAFRVAGVSVAYDAVDAQVADAADYALPRGQLVKLLELPPVRNAYRTARLRAMAIDKRWSELARQQVRKALAFEGEEHDVEILGTNFRVLRGAFSPKYFGSTQFFAESIPYPPMGGSFLEVGCGVGVALLMALRKGASQVYGSDIDSTAVDSARINLSRHASGLNGRWTLMVGDALEPWEGTRPDVVCWNLPFHYSGVAERGELAVIDPQWRGVELFFRRCPKLLESGSDIFVGWSTSGDQGRLDELLHANRLHVSQVVKKSGDALGWGFEYQLLKIGLAP